MSARSLRQVLCCDATDQVAPDDCKSLQNAADTRRIRGRRPMLDGALDSVLAELARCAGWDVQGRRVADCFGFFGR